MPGQKVDIPSCGHCGKPFQAYLFQLARGWGRFCSVSCGSASRTRERNAAWKTGDVTYEAAHYRVKAARGPATDQMCTCGTPADEWAYTHNDPDELLSPKGRPYSTDTNFYVPMCRSCHRRGDIQRKRSKA